MKMSNAYEIVISEYLDKCSCCDECFAEFYCMRNDLRDGRVSSDKNKCIDKIKGYFKEL